MVEVTKFNKKIFKYSQKEFLTKLGIIEGKLLTIGCRNDKVVFEVEV